MKKLIIICTLIEIALISLIIYTLKDGSCSERAETTPITTERVNTIPGEIEEPIYIYEGLEDVKM